MSEELKDMSLAELFRLEAEGQLEALTQGLLAVEEGDRTAAQLEAMMRAAHSLKGAARIVGIEAAVRVAHVMEDCFVAAQRGALALGQAQVDRLLAGVDAIARIARSSDGELAAWDGARAGEIDRVVAGLQDVLTGQPLEPLAKEKAPEAESASVAFTDAESAGAAGTDARVLRVTAGNLNRLLGLAAESLVDSRWVRPFNASLVRLKKLHRELAASLETLRDRVGESEAREIVAVAQRQLTQCREYLESRLGELEAYDRRATGLSHRLYGEALAVRMRPFADGVGAFPRMVRDVARELGKDVKLVVLGEDTQVDRDILEKLEAPLGHLLRNAVDHGIEAPLDRVAAGKPATGTITLEARHSAGVLLVTVSDDGRGLDPETIRAAVVSKKLVAGDTAPRLSEAELLEFLFLPGFTLRDTVTEISGRGVGLDAVQTMAKDVRGTVRVASQPGRGMRFQLQLPLTLSVVRALLVQIAGEPYAIPLGFIARTLRLAEAEIASTQGRQHFAFEGRRVGLVAAQQVLGRPGAPRSGELAVVILGEGEHRHGVVVDAFLGEKELVVQPLDARLGKVKDIAAGALMEDGAPVLIIDVADFVRSVEKIAAAGQLSAIRADAASSAAAGRKRVLVVDDSLTVRELERKLLEARGYTVEIAVDGMDGWNAVRTGAFALVISDVDMPRLDGIELTRLIKADARLREVPVMIVSYKDREEDRRRGLDAGADYYLTKGSFHDETMLNAVTDLIGPALETEDAR
jgi:two-component system sensor histidine kinase and response regulator WspE